jgi:hypothetical protein
VESHHETGVVSAEPSWRLCVKSPEPKTVCVA